MALHKAQVILSFWEHSLEIQGQGQFAKTTDMSTGAQALCTQRSTWYSVAAQCPPYVITTDTLASTVEKLSCRNAK